MNVIMKYKGMEWNYRTVAEAIEGYERMGLIGRAYIYCDDKIISYGI